MLLVLRRPRPERQSQRAVCHSATELCDDSQNEILLNTIQQFQPDAQMAVFYRACNTAGMYLRFLLLPRDTYFSPLTAGPLRHDSLARVGTLRMLPIVVLWLAQATGGVQPGGVPTQTPVPHVTPDLASASADPSKEAANVPSPVVTPDPLSASPEVLATVPPDEHGFNGVLVGDNATEGEIEALEGHEGDLAPSIMKNLAVADENPLCTSWAEAGECIKNPQYMFVACAHACGALQYSDIEADCSGWAQHGECEKNPG